MRMPHPRKEVVVADSASAGAQNHGTESQGSERGNLRPCLGCSQALAQLSCHPSRGASVSAPEWRPDRGCLRGFMKDWSF